MSLGKQSTGSKQALLGCSSLLWRDWQHRGAGTKEETQQQALTLADVRMRLSYFMYVHDSAASADNSVSEALEQQKGVMFALVEVPLS